MTAAAVAGSSSTDRRPLPADIELEILLRLPVKTLFRFKSASKSWYSLISSPQFQKDHYRRAQHNPPLLLALHTEENVFIDPTLIDRSTFCFKAYNNDGDGTLTLVSRFSKTFPECYYLPFMRSCLGLVCISPGRYGTEPILICNPSTQELVTLPPTSGPKSVGFGYATSTHEFKVVGFFYFERDGMSFYREDDECAVFTLGTTHWRKVRSPPFKVEKGNAPFLHQAIHFLLYVEMGVKDTDYIAVFDIDTEEVGVKLLEYHPQDGIVKLKKDKKWAGTFFVESLYTLSRQ